MTCRCGQVAHQIYRTNDTLLRETISLYQRSTLAGMFSDQMKQGVNTLQQSFNAGHSAGTELVRAPAIQIIPLAIFV